MREFLNTFFAFKKPSWDSIFHRVPENNGFMFHLLKLIKRNVISLSLLTKDWMSFMFSIYT
nr:MAG TPA: hypothetical protein [Bacteriophage sp.]